LVYLFKLLGLLGLFQNKLECNGRAGGGVKILTTLLYLGSFRGSIINYVYK